MPIRSFRDASTAELWTTGQSRAFPGNLHDAILRKLHMVNAAVIIRDLTVPSNRTPTHEGPMPRTASRRLLLSLMGLLAGLVPMACGLDADARALVLSPASLTVAEGGTAGAYTIALGSQPVAPTTINLTGTSDFSVSPAQVVFTTGNWNVPQTVTVTAIDDSMIEGSEIQAVAHAVLDDANNSDYEGLGLSPTTVTVTSANDVVGYVLSASALDVPEAGNVRLRIHLKSQPAGDVTIAAALSSGNLGGRDSLSPTTLTFTAADWATDQEVVVATTADGGSLNETYHLDLTVASAPTETVGSWANPGTLSCTNIDDDVPGIRITQTGGSTIVVEGGATDAYTINLTTQPDAGSNFVQVNIHPPAGISVNPTSLLWTRAECGGDWSTFAGVGKATTVTAIDDGLAEGTQILSVAHQVGSTDAASYVAAPLIALGVQVNDNDAVGVSIAPTSGLIVTEAGAQAQVFVRLLSQPAGGATVSFTLAMGGADPDEATVSPAALTFTSANWNVSQTVTVTGVNDSSVDGDRTWAVVTGNTVSADGSYSGLVVPDLNGTTFDIPSVVTTLALASSDSTSDFGQSVTCTATIGGGATGTVLFLDGSTTLLGSATISGGSASLTTAALAVGSHAITAFYLGDASHGASGSAVVTQTVSAIAPGAPTAVVATAGDGQASVAFTVPASTGGAAITGYTVTASSGQTVSGAASPIVVPGLANGTTVTFTVTATNSATLTGPASVVSNSVTPGVAGTGGSGAPAASDSCGVGAGAALALLCFLALIPLRSRRRHR